jgi:DNA-binding transcriptional regulator YiaG
MRTMEVQVRQLMKIAAKAAPSEPSAPPSGKFRFSAKGLAAQRRRLGLSANECGLLVGASGQSIYKWEEGKAHPRAKNLPGIAGLRTLSKKEASARLEAIA